MSETQLINRVLNRSFCSKGEKPNKEMQDALSNTDVDKVIDLWEMSNSSYDLNQIANMIDFVRLNCDKTLQTFTSLLEIVIFFKPMAYGDTRDTFFALEELLELEVERAKKIQPKLALMHATDPAYRSATSKFHRIPEDVAHHIGTYLDGGKRKNGKTKIRRRTRTRKTKNRQRTRTKNRRTGVRK